MPITKLNLTSFRNLSSISLPLLPRGINVIYGKNGSGKTSILESICTMSCGKSFRTNDLNRLIQSSEFDNSANVCLNELSVYAELLQENTNSIVQVGISRTARSGFKVKLLGNPSSFSELARILPVRIISPVETNELINAGPDIRRSFLDWGVFHVKHDYWVFVRRFNKLLKQRNAALKSRCSRTELLEWNKQFCELSYLIHESRLEYFKQWRLELQEILRISQIFNKLEVNYFAGWGANPNGNERQDNLLEILLTLEAKERELGYSVAGPHRADLILSHAQKGDGVMAKEHLSRGQQKLLAISMYLAQGEFLKKNKGYYPLFLIDDFTSELDTNSQELLLNILNPEEKQIIITALDLEHPALRKFISNHKVKIFSLDQGTLIEQSDKHCSS